MRRLLVIDKCEDCPHHVHDDNDVPERYGKSWCRMLDVEVVALEIHDPCILTLAASSPPRDEKQEKTDV